MSKVKLSTGTNPFQPIIENKPVNTVTDYNNEDSKYIIEYGQVERVVITGKKDTDFVIKKDVKELSRVNRADYINSYDGDVGIMNILQKVRLSGDMSLLNQTGRVPLPSVEKDVEGHLLEPVVDITNYQVDRIDALESYKAGRSQLKELPEDLVKGKSFEAVAKMSDKEIIDYLDGVKAAILAKNTVVKGDKE